MRRIFILTIALLTLITKLNAQTRTIYGRVISDELQPIAGIHVINQDTMFLTKTDTSGKFKVSIPKDMQTLIFNWIGFESATVKLNDNCDTVDVILFKQGTYDRQTAAGIDRARLARFKQLPSLYLTAYQKGLFTKPSPCYTREFEPWKAKLEQIQKGSEKKLKQIALTFEKLKIGDTVRIPYGAPYDADKNGKTHLQPFSAFNANKSFDCEIKGVIIDKNKKNRGYNLVYRVISCDDCKTPGQYDDKDMKVGEIFTHNMRNYKILE
ncbi:MAG: carboxypeptidase-like regulatory domain-containing protein [Bacteroidota bacterium]